MRAYHPTMARPSAGVTLGPPAGTMSHRALSLDLEGARRVAAAAVREGILPCAVFGVTDANDTLATHAVSGRDRDVDERTIFFLASVTKPIVATAIMQYVDEGRLELHRPFARYLPEVGEALAHVTPWHVLTHTSGLPDALIESLARERPSYLRMLETVLASRPEFPPGARFRYASAPWMLLAALMTRLSGMAFRDALRVRLTGPLRMDDTRFDPRHARGRVATVHGLRIRNRVMAEVLMRFMARAMLPGGGLFGTTTDLLAFGRALLATADPDGSGPRLLSRAGMDEMAREQTADLLETLDDGTTRPARWALGWAKPRPGSPGGPSVITHGGAAGGRLWVDPELGFAFVFLTNLWDAPDEPALSVLEEVYRAVEATR
jgi:CubicO group peptidase (beta-lactamase class C family)